MILFPLEANFAYQYVPFGARFLKKFGHKMIRVPVTNEKRTKDAHVRGPEKLHAQHSQTQTSKKHTLDCRNQNKLQVRCSIKLVLYQVSERCFQFDVHWKLLVGLFLKVDMSMDAMFDLDALLGVLF